eukprot:6210462-Pleurochrysis_carterae.AAC.1
MVQECNFIEFNHKLPSIAVGVVRPGSAYTCTGIRKDRTSDLRIAQFANEPPRETLALGNTHLVMYFIPVKRNNR